MSEQLSEVELGGGKPSFCCVGGLQIPWQDAPMCLALPLHWGHIAVGAKAKGITGDGHSLLK